MVQNYEFKSMMNTKIFAALFLLVAALTSYSCKSDSATAVVLSNVDLAGQWKIQEAYKGKTKTNLLDNGYFSFSESGNITTNILGDETPSEYKLSKNLITVEEGLVKKYTVEKKTTDTLILTTRIRNFDFRFIALKSDS